MPIRKSCGCRSRELLNEQKSFQAPRATARHLEPARRQPARQRRSPPPSCSSPASVALAFWSSHADYGLLYGGLSDTEAAKVIAALDDAKVPTKPAPAARSWCRRTKFMRCGCNWPARAFRRATASGSKFSTSRTSAFPISSSAPITSAPCRANWPAPSARLTRSSPRA